MARIDTLTNFLTDVAAAIKTKTGKTAPITPASFDTEIESIQSGGDTSIEDGLIEGTVTEYSNDRVTKVANACFNGNTLIQKVNMSSVKTIHASAFEKCTSLIEVNFPAAESTNLGVFYKCTSLKTANLPLLKSIEAQSFYKCSLLTAANFPLATMIGGSSFSGCTSLVDTNFSSATTIVNNAFLECTSLTILDFPKVTEIRESVFNDSSLLETVILRSTTLCTLGNSTGFNNTPIGNGTGYIYVPRALIEDYKVATNWTTYAAQFRAIEDYPDICGEVTE